MRSKRDFVNKNSDFEKGRMGELTVYVEYSTTRSTTIIFRGGFSFLIFGIQRIDVFQSKL